MDGKDIRWLSSVVIKDDSFYCMPGESNAIYKVTFQDWKITKVFQTSYREIGRWSVCGNMDYIYGIPNKGIRFIVYEIETGKGSSFESGDEETELAESVWYDQKIWFIPRNLPCGMWFFSFPETSFFENLKWKEELKRLKVSGRVTRWYIEKEKIYLVLFREKRILQYDLYSDQMVDITPPMEEGFYDIVCMGDCLFFLTKDNEKMLYGWNLKNKKIWKLRGDGEGSYRKLIKIGNELLLDTGMGLEVLKNGRISATDIRFCTQPEGANYINAVTLTSKRMLLPWGQPGFLVFS